VLPLLLQIGLQKLAKELSVHILAGIHEIPEESEHDEDEEGPDSQRVYNTCVVIDPQGKVIRNYRKGWSSLFFSLLCHETLPFFKPICYILPISPALLAQMFLPPSSPVHLFDVDLKESSAAGPNGPLEKPKEVDPCPEESAINEKRKTKGESERIRRGKVIEDPIDLPIGRVGCVLSFLICFSLPKDQGC
jgi:hypothetical protein